MARKYKVAILDCGGTISMTKEEGIAKLGEEALNFEKIIHHSEHTRDIDLIIKEKVLQQDSSDAVPADWLYAGKKAIDQLKDIDDLNGVVISHGTDTAAYAVMTLSYVLKKLPVPVVLTGSQIPARNPDNSLNYESDAFNNLQDSVNVAAKSGIAECCLVFDHKIYGPENLAKKDAWGADAFTNISRDIMGTVKDSDIEIFYSDTKRNAGKDYYIDDKFDPQKVGYVKIEPNLSYKVLNNTAKEYEAIVLDTFGGGNLPERLRTNSIIKQVNEGKFFINCCQPEGIVNMAQGYDLGFEFLKAGQKKGDELPLYVITGGDWTAAYAETRMAYILGHKDDIETIASKEGLDPAHLTHAIFIAGVKFADDKSRKNYKDITGIKAYPENILHYNDFKEVAEKIAKYQWD